MTDRAKVATAAAVLLAGVLAGLVVARRHELRSFFQPRRTGSWGLATPAARAGRGPSEQPSSHKVETFLRAREVRILRPDSSIGVQLGVSGEGSPGIWVSDARKRGITVLGVHSNGFPFVGVSDGADRNFGLGRVDGRNASPILVFRRDDIVRVVFGLSMTEKGQPAFLVHYTANGDKRLVFGSYCDRPDRVCTN